jgi:potassium uptake TrkH family protein
MIRRITQSLMRIVRHPLRLLVLSFGVLIIVGAVLLRLPVAAQEGFSPNFLVALFTATSAVCVTGLTLVDTGTHWSGFGQGVILLLIQLGGLGIVTLATVLFLALSNRLGFLQVKALAAESGAESLHSIGRIVRVIVITTLAIEAVVAVVLFVRLYFAYDYELGDAVYHGVFHAVSAWNNAGFSLYAESASRFVTDWFMLLVIASAIIFGGIGFPVLQGFWQHRMNISRWSLHMKLMVSGTIALLVIGFVGYLAFEWSNAETFGPLSVRQKIVVAFFQSAQSRTAGFNAVDTSQLGEESILVSIALMFIGGGSASTAGGIKVTTFALLAFVMWAEIRGDQEVSVFRRRVASTVQRQAVTISLATLGIATMATFAFLTVSDNDLVTSVFEVVSALGTVGLSLGSVDYSTDASKALVTVLMFVGRLGPLTLATALAARSLPSLIRYPEDRPLIG